MPTHYVVRVPSDADSVNTAIKENESKTAGLIQVLPVVAEGTTSEVMLVFRQSDDSGERAAGFRVH